MEAEGEIVVVLDADTIISGDAVSLMVRHFADPNIAAVSGNVKVGNVRNIWTMWQHVEYVTGLNLERRAFDALNCITVVPGAIGAWRKELVAKAGYYKEDTLAEDADITLTFLQQGYKIVYEEGAKAFTEAPEDLKSLLKQRVRWAYGTLQCLWKHRGALFNKSQKSLGFVALPNTWLYQVVFQSLSPLTDILFFLGVICGNGTETVLTYIIFFLIDFVVTCYAFRLEKESLKPLAGLFIQRLVYRQLMTYVVYKSILSALRGVKVGWNKLNRLGNVPQ
jgi:cellulose synthase/poly-beta-1,6-N-acetylglucosamine synthase-like glycosyltransferase